jgi:hypothetical protein
MVTIDQMERLISSRFQLEASELFRELPLIYMMENPCSIFQAPHFPLLNHYKTS